MRLRCENIMRELPAQKIDREGDSCYVDIVKAIRIDKDVILSGNPFQKVVRDAFYEYPESVILQSFRDDYVLRARVQKVLLGNVQKNDFLRLVQRVHTTSSTAAQKEALFQIFKMMEDAAKGLTSQTE